MSAAQPHSHHKMASDAAAPAASPTAGANDPSTPSHATATCPPRRAAPRARRSRQVSSQPQPPPPSTAGDGGAAGVASSRERPADGPLAALNARQRRSAERSAQRHMQRQRFTRSRMILVLFIVRLRRRARLRRDLRDLEELDWARPPAVKRGHESEPPSSSASSCDAQDSDHHHIFGVVKTSTRVSHLAKRFGGDTGQLLLR